MNEDKLLLAKALAALDSSRKKLKMSTESIAVVGMSCRFPDGANSPEEFWKLLDQGFDASREVPENRWDIDDYYDGNPGIPG